jgi:DNA-binding response OmpR family regulator
VNCDRNTTSCQPGYQATHSVKASLQQAHYTILVVDDDDLIREGLVGYLENFHEAPYQLKVLGSENPAVAKTVLASQPVDLVITDVNMPNEDGFSLIQYIQKHFSTTKTAMITAYRIEDYVRNAKQSGVFNIIAKMAPFDFEELSLVVNNLLEPKTAFGLERYLLPDCQIKPFTIRCSQDITTVLLELENLLKQTALIQTNDMMTALTEAMTNAVYHVGKKPDGTLKYDKGAVIEALDPSEYVSVYYGQDMQKFGVSIVDQGGRITSEEILYWLERNISGNGIMDNHGRGVYLIHRLVDRLLINILSGSQTEMILLHHFDRHGNRSANKPIYINQLSA